MASRLAGSSIQGIALPVLDSGPCPQERKAPSPTTLVLSVPRCASFTVYTSWGEHCEHLSVKLGAFFGILFGTLGTLLLLGILAFVVFHFWDCSRNKFSYRLDSEL